MVDAFKNMDKIEKEQYWFSDFEIFFIWIESFVWRISLWQL